MRLLAGGWSAVYYLISPLSHSSACHVCVLLPHCVVGTMRLCLEFWWGILVEVDAGREIASLRLSLIFALHHMCWVQCKCDSSYCFGTIICGKHFDHQYTKYFTLHNYTFTCRTRQPQVRNLPNAGISCYLQEDFIGGVDTLSEEVGKGAALSA